MELLNKYFELQNQIYNYFGYIEGWKVIPLDDHTQYVWHITNEENGEVLFADLKEDFKTENYYSDEIFTYRHLSKWVYRAKDYTMVVVDTNTDGNKFLAIFDNKKELLKNPLED